VFGQGDDVGLIGQEEHLEDVAGFLGHRDGVGVDGVAAVLGLPVGEAVEQLEDARRVVREFRGVAEVDHRLVLQNGVGQELDAVGFRELVVVDPLGFERLGDGVGVFC